MPNSTYGSSPTGADGMVPAGPVRSVGAPINQTVAPGLDPPRNTGALSALFARTSRKSERVICPINDSALEEGNLNPAFYCVHSLSGAGGTDFCALAELMPAVRFYGLQAPLAKMQDANFGGSVEAIADYYANVLVKFQPKGAFLLGGWSAGAIIGLQIAQNLRGRGREVSLLVAIDAAPENVAAGFRPWNPLYLLQLVCNMPRWIIHEDLMKTGVLRALVRRVSSKVVAFGNAKKGGERRGMVDSHTVEGFMDLSRYPLDQRRFMTRLYDALVDYTPREYPGNVVVYEAKVKPLLHLPQVGKVWRKLAARSTIVYVNGTHLSVLQKPHVKALAEDLRERIFDSTRALCGAMPQADVSSPPEHPSQLTGRILAA